MLSRSSLAGAALLLATLAPLSRADAPTAPLPESVQQIIKGMHLENVSNISYRDAADKEISAQQFAELRKDRQPFTVTKGGKGQDMVAILSITTAEAIKAMAPPPPTLKAGQPFPPFLLAKLDGAAFDNANLRGRYSLINFYFAQCAPCIKEVPELNALAQQRADMNFVGVTFDTPDETRQFAAETRFEWMLVPESKKLIDELRIRSYPSFVLLDPQGKVVAIERHDAIVREHKTITAWVAQAAPK